LAQCLFSLVLFNVNYDDEYKTKENKNRTKDKIELQHNHSHSLHLIIENIEGVDHPVTPDC